MAPVPIYSQSPINAAKASGVTPKTDSPAPNPSKASSYVPRTTATTTAVPEPFFGAAGRTRTPPPPQPGAVPSLPRLTGTAPGNYYNNTSSHYMTGPPRSARSSSKNAAKNNPPPPQPGAAPLAPTGGPPRITSTHTATASTGSTSTRASSSISTSSDTCPTHYSHPPQMAFLPPAAADYPPPRGTSTSTGPPYFSGFPRNSAQPVRLPRTEEPDLSHPPGYQQNIHAASMGVSQMESGRVADSHTGYHKAGSMDDQFGEDDEGVWDAAKKLAKTAGERLSEAESEIWRLINKDE